MRHMTQLRTKCSSLINTWSFLARIVEGYHEEREGNGRTDGPLHGPTDISLCKRKVRRRTRTLFTESDLCVQVAPFMYSRCREIECAGVPCLAKRMMGSPLSLSRPWALLILSAKDVSQVILPPQCSSTDNHPPENLIRECCTAAADVCIPGALHSSRCRSPNAPHFPAMHPN